MAAIENDRLVGAVFDALVSGVSLEAVAIAAAGGSIISILDKVSENSTVEEIDEKTKQMEALLRMRLVGLKNKTLDTLDALINAANCEESIDSGEFRSIELVRRTCISLLRLNMFSRTRNLPVITDRGLIADGGGASCSNNGNSTSKMPVPPGSVDTGGVAVSSRVGLELPAVRFTDDHKSISNGESVSKNKQSVDTSRLEKKYKDRRKQKKHTKKSTNRASYNKNKAETNGKIKNRHSSGILTTATPVTEHGIFLRSKSALLSSDPLHPP